MNYNWNVYKVFKNGKRAKAPMANFEATEENYVLYFENEVKKNFSENLKRGGFEIVRSDLPQERQSEIVDEREEKISKEKNRVLGRLAAQQKIDYKYKIATSLVYCKESDWKWQWAAVGSGTTKYLRGLSPTFKTYDEAHVWIQELMAMNSH